MNQYCHIRQQLYLEYCNASAEHYRNGTAVNWERYVCAKDALMAHHRNCQQCRDHAAEMARLAQNAQMPELED